MDWDIIVEKYLNEDIFFFKNKRVILCPINKFHEYFSITKKALIAH